MIIIKGLSKHGDEYTKGKIFKISTAVVAYASQTSGAKLSEKCNATASAIDYMRDNDFYTYAKLVINEATPIMSALNPFGIVAADLTNANTSATTYLANIQSPRVQISDRTKALDELDMLFDAANIFINQKLDPVMGIFSATNPGLYTGYLSARSIDQTGAAATPDYQGTINADSYVLVAELPYLSGRGFEFRNDSSIPLIFSLSQNPDTIEGTPITVSKGGSNQRQTANLNTNNLATKLYVRNVDLSTGGSYKIFIQE